MKKLGYIRIPKTGSGSFENYLKYDQQKYIIYGIHHLPYTIISQKNKIDEYFSFVRNPLQLYSSFYFFMKKRIFTFDNPNNPLEYTDQNKFNIELIKNNVNLEEFLLNCPKNQMLSYFIDPLPLEELKFIGITEKMNESISIFNNFFNLNVKNNILNINESKNFEDKYIVRKEIENKFKKRNEREYEIYIRASEIFSQYEKRKIYV